MEKIAVIADDFTGAGDAAVPFVEAGIPMTLHIHGFSARPDYTVGSGGLTVDSESRFLGRREAADRVAAIFASCARAGWELFFKKTDSALRGNPGAETEAALAATGRRAVLFCSAIPAMGRVCRDGVMRLKGMPLADSEIGRDQFTPLLSSRVEDILSFQTDLPSAGLSLATIRRGAEAGLEATEELLRNGAKIIVADAETDDDLAVLAEILLENPELLPAGASGLSRMVARAIAPRGSVAQSGPAMRGRFLAVIGSLTSTAREQAERLLEDGRFRSARVRVGAARSDPGGEIARLLAENADGGADGLVLTADDSGAGFDVESGALVASFLGRAARALFDAGGYSVVYSTGGSTSVAVAAALGLERIILQREPLPGLAQGVFERGGRTRWFVSKAGGFGSRETLRELCALIERE